jgi:uncharacterized protein YqgV (UPF0045/DUF77 family)
MVGMASALDTGDNARGRVLQVTVCNHPSTCLIESTPKGTIHMLLELSVSVKGKHDRVADPSLDINRIVDASGLHYKTTGRGTVLEGSWEQLMAVAKKCHDEVLKKNDQFVTHMKAVDKKCGGSLAPSPCSGKELEEVLEDEGEWLML